MRDSPITSLLLCLHSPVFCAVVFVWEPNRCRPHPRAPLPSDFCSGSANGQHKQQVEGGREEWLGCSLLCFISVGLRQDDHIPRLKVAVLPDGFLCVSFFLVLGTPSLSPSRCFLTHDSACSQGAVLFIHCALLALSSPGSHLT